MYDVPFSKPGRRRVLMGERDVVSFSQTMQIIISTNLTNAD